MTLFPILDVTDWPVEALEPIGDDPKDWLVAPDETQWLFKPRVVHDGWEQGEDWAEKIAAELASQLGIPAAGIELACRGERRGSLSRKIIPDGYTLQPGEVLIAQFLPDYQPRTRERRGHNLAVIQQVLQGFGPPPGATDADHLDAFDVFAGYLVLDALIANTDRHEQNWAVLLGETGTSRTLAQSFDHATSLGFNFRDSRRQAYLAGHQLAVWARQGTAQRFEARADGSRPTLVGLAHSALDRSSAPAKRRWMAAVDGLDLEELRAMVDQIPDMSVLARTFAVDVVTTNRRRLLDGD